jgi:hypothetical protein
MGSDGQSKRKDLKNKKKRYVGQGVRAIHAI